MGRIRYNFKYEISGKSLILVPDRIALCHTLFDTFSSSAFGANIPERTREKPKAIATKHHQGQIPNIVVTDVTYSIPVSIRKYVQFINKSLIYLLQKIMDLPKARSLDWTGPQPRVEQCAWLCRPRSSITFMTPAHASPRSLSGRQKISSGTVDSVQCMPPNYI